MSFDMEAISELPVARVSDIYIGLEPARWAFSDELREEIDTHFAKLRRLRPAIWNGGVLLLREYTLEGDCFRGKAFTTDFASFLAWRDWGFPDREVTNFFAMGALRSADGVFLLGVMAAHTANAGRIYFPAGTPDLNDIRGGKVDLDGSMWRELNEETGLSVAELEADAQWRVVLAGPRIVFIKVLHAPVAADELRRRIRAHMAREAAPELADIRLVRGPHDLDAQMPPFVMAFLQSMWS